MLDAETLLLNALWAENDQEELNQVQNLNRLFSSLRVAPGVDTLQCARVDCVASTVASLLSDLETVTRQPRWSSKSDVERTARPEDRHLPDWFLAHFSNPFPTSQEYAWLAEATSMTTKQVKTWFVNHRKRSGWTNLLRHSNGNKAKLRHLLEQGDHVVSEYPELFIEARRVRKWFERDQDQVNPELIKLTERHKQQQQRSVSGSSSTGSSSTPCLSLSTSSASSSDASDSPSSLEDLLVAVDEEPPVEVYQDLLLMNAPCSLDADLETMLNESLSSTKPDPAPLPMFAAAPKQEQQGEAGSTNDLFATLFDHPFADLLIPPTSSSPRSQPELRVPTEFRNDGLENDSFDLFDWLNSV